MTASGRFIAVGAALRGLAPLVWLTLTASLCLRQQRAVASRDGLGVAHHATPYGWYDGAEGDTR